MLKKITLLIFILVGMAAAVEAQILGPVPSPFASIEDNNVSNMAAIGDTLWIGPGLNRMINNTGQWYLPKNATQITEDNGRVYSLDLSPDTVWTGLGYNTAGGVQSGLGFYYSTDGGDTWDFIPNPNEKRDDTTFVYGGKAYNKLAITTQEQSPPFDIARNGNVVLSANWALGIVRSTNFGKSWNRLILPPQNADSLVPENSYSFKSNGVNRYDPRADQNLLGFSVLIDNTHNVWAGTAGGLNISANALQAPVDSVRWQHIQFDSSADGLLSNWIITIRQQPSNEAVWMTNWISGLSQDERYGIVRTTDGGKSFQQFLKGKRINDIGFKDGAIFAAGDAGLFKSTNNGQSWSKISPIRSNNSFIKSTAQYYSLAATTNRLWVGSNDGIASTKNLGKDWEITRVNFPLDGKNQYQQDAPDVKNYAYPNPFSPRRQQQVRIKFSVEKAGNVRIRLFDFGMNLIRELDSGFYSADTYEATWDGKDSQGNPVANGVVFYQIDTPQHTLRGKILVLD